MTGLFYYTGAIVWILLIAFAIVFLHALLRHQWKVKWYMWICNAIEYPYVIYKVRFKMSQDSIDRTYKVFTQAKFANKGFWQRKLYEYITKKASEDAKGSNKG